jgi:hypothetical protein
MRALLNKEPAVSKAWRRYGNLFFFGMAQPFMNAASFRFYQPAATHVLGARILPLV